MRTLVVLLFLPLLAAQNGGGKEPPPSPPRPAASPVRFTEFPVADGAPLDVEAATARALQAMLQLGEGDGDEQWPYEGVYREDGGQLPVGYRVGGTAIACLAMAMAPGLDGDAARQKALERGIGFVVENLDHARMSVDFIGTYDVRGWGHIYALLLFLHLLDRGLVPPDLAGAVADKTNWLVAALCESAIPEAGGWNYSRRAGYQNPRNRASTFMTAPALQALFHAQARGYEVSDTVLDQALDALDRARSAPGGYAYGAPRDSQNEVPAEELKMMDKVGSTAARGALIETTLLLAGRGDPERQRRAIDLFFEYWDDLAVRKSQTGTHVPPYGIAPYYFMFGHLYAAQAIELLPDGDDKTELRARLLRHLARSRDSDGTWNDRHFGRSAAYGTALAVLTMQMPGLPKPVARTVRAAAGK